MQTPVARTRVLVAEDHPLFRHGTRQILEQEPDLEVVGEVERGDQVLAETGRLDPHVVLVDIRLPGLSGIEVAKRLAAEHPDVRVIVLTAFEDDQYVMEALSAGVSGYLLKTAPAEEIVSAVRAVRTGSFVLQETISRRLGWQRMGQRTRAPLQLSVRELQIVRLITEGLHNKQIARKLGISPRTVDAHLNNSFSKLGVSSRTELVRVAMAQRLVSVEDAE